MEAGHVVRAVYDFQTDLEGELSLQVGDVIQVTKKIDKQWLQGITARRKGNFPSSFVMIIKLPHITSNQKLFAATDNFVAQEDGDLSFNRGDIIVGKRPIDNNWWTGDCDGRQGIFPLTHVWELDSAKIKREEGRKKVNLKARVKMDIKAQLPKEIDLRKGEIVTVTELTDENWYTGISGGKTGMFPATFVTLIDDPATETIVPSSDVFNIQETSHTESPTVKVNGIEPMPDDNSSLSSDDQFGYDNTNSGITPYGRARSSFVAEYPNELTFGRGEIITLMRHIDDEWMEGELDGKIGLFPLNYIDVIVDCVDNRNAKQKSNNTQSKSDKECIFPAETYGRVLYDYESQVQGDLALKEGEIVTLRRALNSSWFEAATSNGNVGLCPANFIYILGSNSLTLPHYDPPSSQNNLPVPSSYDLTDWADPSKIMIKPEKPPPPYSAVVNSTDWPQGTSFNSRNQSNSKSLDDSIAFNAQKLDLNVSTGRTQARTLPRNTFSSNHSNMTRSKDRSLSLIIDDTRTGRERSSTDLLSYEEALHQTQPLSNTHNYNLAQSYTEENNTFSEASHNSRIPSKASSSPHSSHIGIEGSFQRTPLRPAPLLPVSRQSSIISAGEVQNESTEYENVGNIHQEVSEKENQIQKLERCKKKLLQEKNYDHGKSGNVRSSIELGKEISFCDKEIARLQTEIKDLQDNVSTPASETTTSVQGDDIEERLRREEEVERKRKEELERREAERRKKMKEQRQCVILELLQTEKDYLFGLKVCHATFLSDPEKGKAKGIEMGTLFGNLDEVIEMASRLLKKLEETMQYGNPDNQLIGDCFLDLADDLKEVYGHYCRNHDDIHTLLDKYEKNPQSFQYLKDGVEVMRQRTNCFDLRSVLIKPVQRILKYPLLLNELVKCTEDGHRDKKKLSNAVHLMTDVATQINEFKRKKDLVFKYRKDTDTSLSTRISKLNLHSVMKKSSRFGIRLSSSIGLKTMTRDEAFENVEHDFRSLTKTIKIFLKDVNTFNEHMQDYAVTALNVAEDIADFYQERKTQLEVDELRTAHRIVATQFWEEFKISTERNVTDPLKQLLHMFNGPNNLIQKRNDKLLDYDACSSRLERNKDITKQKSLQEEQQLSKNTYEALNSQLLDDLPKLLKLSTEILNDCVVAFLQARKKFLGGTAKQMIDLMELPLLMGNKSSFLETFQVKHNIAVARLSDFSSSIRHLFVSNSAAVKSETAGKKTSPGTHNLRLGSLETGVQQTTNQRTYLKSKYEKSCLYDVDHTFLAVDALDISVQKGDLVRVIKKQDPMGSPHRWFVDNGNSQGFVPAKFLKPLNISSCDTSSDATNKKHSASPNQTLLAQCMKVESNKTNIENNANKRNSLSKQSELCDTSFQSEQYENLIDISPSNGEQQRYSNIPFNEFDPYAPVNSANTSCASDASSEDLYTAHRYETIPDDPLSAVSQPNMPTHVNPVVNEYYFAAYPFVAKGSHQLSVSKGQAVLVHYRNDLHGNSDWWYVEDRHGNQGYVPGNYLVKYMGS